MNAQQVAEAMSLKWQHRQLSPKLHLFTHEDCLGSIVFDEDKQVIYPCNSAYPNEVRLHTEIAFYTDPKRFVPMSELRVLECENNALSNFKKPHRYYANPFKLFKAMQENEAEGTLAVFGHYYTDLDGTHKWGWIRIEWDVEYKVFGLFSEALANLATPNDEVAYKKAINVLKYLTGVQWSKDDQTILVGMLSDGVGFKWLTNASICTAERLNDFGGDMESDVVRCLCGFAHSVSWGLGYTGDFIAALHQAHKIHQERHPDCQHELR